MVQSRRVTVLLLTAATIFCHTPAFGQGDVKPIPVTTDEAILSFLDRPDFPPIPSENADKRIDTGIRDSELNAMINRFNRSIFHDAVHFEVVSGSFGNVLMDTQRQLVLLDPQILAALIKTANADAADAELITMALLAHELSHYVLALMELEFPGKTFELDLEIPAEHMEHALVEAIACELLQQTGFSAEETRKAMDLLHKASDTAFGIVSELSTDDRKMRRLAVEKWLSEQSLKISVRPSFGP